LVEMIEFSLLCPPVEHVQPVGNQLFEVTDIRPGGPRLEWWLIWPANLSQPILEISEYLVRNVEPKRSWGSHFRDLVLVQERRSNSFFCDELNIERYELHVKTYLPSFSFHLDRSTAC